MTVCNKGGRHDINGLRSFLLPVGNTSGSLNTQQLRAGFLPVFAGTYII